jgi:hypothetical protein
MYTYELTNLEFQGVEVTTTENGFVRDTLRFSCGNIHCTLKQVKHYREIINSIRKRRGSAITAALTLDGTPSVTVKEADDLADAICELISFAKKNTVYWLRRFTQTPDGTILSSDRSIGARVRPLRAGWGIIPDSVAVPGKGLWPAFQYYLSCLSHRYVAEFRHRLALPIAWIIDSEHQSTVDMMYIAAYIAIEHLRKSFLKRDAIPPLICNGWAKILGEQGLGDEIISAIEARLGPQTKEKREILLQALKKTNYPTATAELEALCKQFGVTGFDSDLTLLRNKLVHTGTYGDFTFSEGSDLHFKLSHLVDLCVLKIMRYDGYFQHHETGWRTVNV